MKIADVTFGKGTFWRDIDLSKYDFHASDIEPRPDPRVKVELRDLQSTGYEPHSFDRVALDPPYRSETNEEFFVNASYNNFETTEGFNRDQIINLYDAGIQEASRILRPGGQAWVKGADERHGHIQRFFMTDLTPVWELAGFRAIDTFLLLQLGGMPANRFPQRTSRKNYSYLVILEKIAEPGGK